MSAGPGEGLLGAEFELSRLRTFRRAQKVVVRPPPTGVSNPQRLSQRVDAAPAVGMIYECAVCVCIMHVQRAGRHACAHGGDFVAEDLRWVEVDAPSSCCDARAPEPSVVARATTPRARASLPQRGLHTRYRRTGRRARPLRRGRLRRRRAGVGGLILLVHRRRRRVRLLALAAGQLPRCPLPTER